MSFKSFHFCTGSLKILKNENLIAGQNKIKIVCPLAFSNKNKKPGLWVSVIKSTFYDLLVRRQIKGMHLNLTLIVYLNLPLITPSTLPPGIPSRLISTITAPCHDPRDWYNAPIFNDQLSIFPNRSRQ